MTHPFQTNTLEKTIADVRRRLRVLETSARTASASINPTGVIAIRDEGAPLVARPAINFIGPAVSAYDDPVSQQTIISVTVPTIDLGDYVLRSSNPVVIGLDAEAGPGTSGTIAIGYAASALSDSSIAIGEGAEANYDVAIALGNNTLSEGTNDISIGYLAHAGADSTGYDNIAIGHNAQAGTLINHSEWNVAIGPLAQANAGFNATAIGGASVASGDNTTALGVGARAQGEEGAAIGAGAWSQHDYSTAVGRHALTTATHQIMLGTSADTVVIPGAITDGAGNPIGGGGAGTWHADIYTGDGTTAIYSASDTFAANSELIVLNGLIQTPGVDYTVSDTSFTMTTAPDVGDTLQVRYVTA